MEVNHLPQTFIVNSSQFICTGLHNRCFKNKNWTCNSIDEITINESPNPWVQTYSRILYHDINNSHLGDISFEDINCGFYCHKLSLPGKALQSQVNSYLQE